MKRFSFAVLAVLLLVGAAYAGPKLTFEISSIMNTDGKGYGATYKDFACQVTERTGIANIVVELQGSIQPDNSDDLMWTGLVNTAIVNATDAATDNDSWHFQSLDAYANTLRFNVLSGADVGNTVTGVCFPGGR